jgi:hypothetical protein
MKTFTISEEQEAQYLAWAGEHYKTCNYRPDSFGSLNSFSFMPSGIGDSAHVHCPCGEKKYLDAGEEF